MSQNKNSTFMPTIFKCKHLKTEIEVCQGYKEIRKSKWAFISVCLFSLLMENSISNMFPSKVWDAEPGLLFTGTNNDSCIA